MISGSLTQMISRKFLATFAASIRKMYSPRKWFLNVSFDFFLDASLFEQMASGSSKRSMLGKFMFRGSLHFQKFTILKNIFCSFMMTDKFYSLPKNAMSELKFQSMRYYRLIIVGTPLILISAECAKVTGITTKINSSSGRYLFNANIILTYVPKV